MTAVSEIFTVAGKTAVVTGGASGIGRAIALTFAEAGVHVLAADVDERGLNETKATADAEEWRCETAVVDVSSAAAVSGLARRATDFLGDVDFLVNSAGMSRRHAAEDFPESDWDRILDVNLKGTFLCSKEFGRLMLAKGQGRIVNITSIGGVGGYPGSTAYMSSKGGIVQLTKGLAIEWSSRGVTVNAIAPGITKTKLLEKLAEESPAQVEWFLERMAIREMIDPLAIAAATLFLCSPGSRFVTGHVLAVDGGFLAF